jgi:hypothetical protein
LHLVFRVSKRRDRDGYPTSWRDMDNGKDAKVSPDKDVKESRKLQVRGPGLHEAQFPELN